MIRARTRSKMLEHQRNGRRMSKQPPYGTMPDPRDPKRLVPEPEEQHVIRVIRGLHGAGRGLREIARALELRELKRRGKATWNHCLVKSILLREGLTVNPLPANPPARTPEAHPQRFLIEWSTTCFIDPQHASQAILDGPGEFHRVRLARRVLSDDALTAAGSCRCKMPLGLGARRRASARRACQERARVGLPRCRPTCCRHSAVLGLSSTARVSTRPSRMTGPPCRRSHYLLAALGCRRPRTWNSIIHSLSSRNTGTRRACSECRWPPCVQCGRIRPHLKYVWCCDLFCTGASSL